MNQGGEVRGAGIESGGSIFDPALYVPTQGFMGCPNSYDLEGCKLAILGMPFDCGRHPVRIGARQGRETGAVVNARLEHHEPWDLGIFTSVGIDPARTRYLILKSRIHYRAGFARLAKATITCDGDGVTTSDNARLNYQNLRRPIHPLDRINEP